MNDLPATAKRSARELAQERLRALIEQSRRDPHNTEVPAQIADLVSALAD